jgi:tRNA-dihydrouridine synthase A
MIGREAYHNPWWIAQWDSMFFGEPQAGLTREQVEERMTGYMAREAQVHGTPWSAIARHMLGLRNALPGARRWRQVWSDHSLKGLHPRDVMALAHDAVASAAEGQLSAF